MAQSKLFRKLSFGEYRGTPKQFTVAPPSFHPTTRELYRWLIPPGKQIPRIDNPEYFGFLPKTETKKSPNGKRNKNTLLSSLLHSGSFSFGVITNDDRRIAGVFD